MRLERSKNLERLGEDPHLAVIAANEKIVRAGAYGAELITLRESV